MLNSLLFDDNFGFEQKDKSNSASDKGKDFEKVTAFVIVKGKELFMLELKNILLYPELWETIRCGVSGRL